MAGGKEIRTKIKSVENTRKITRAMEMVAAAKMRKAQERMKAARPYSAKIGNVAAHLSLSHPEYRHPFLVKRDTVRRVGIVVITSDKGLCGGLNTNALRLVVSQMKEAERQGIQVDLTCIGNKGFGFFQRAGARIVSHVTGLGDKPHLEKLIGPVKVMLDAYTEGRIDVLYMVSSRFINTMKQEPVYRQLLPLSLAVAEAEARSRAQEKPVAHWDYIYEPDAKTVVDALMVRYIEAIIYQAVAENLASEQSARMVAMKAASENAGSVIDELKLIYNKSRQAAITKELSEIVAGAAAV